MHKKRVWIASGGTGGHLYPAQSLAEELLEVSNTIEVLFIGGGLATNPYLDRDRFPFQQVSAAPFHGISFASIGSCWRMGKGICESLYWMKKLPPDLIVGFGSYLAVPPLAAGCVTGVPILLHEADSLLGRANSWFAPFAKKIGVVFPHAGRSLGEKAVCTHMPLRKGYSLEELSREEAMTYFGLRDSREILLVMGGSQGADMCNQVAEYIQGVSQVVHLSGKKANPALIADAYRKKGIYAIVKPFEPKMQYAWRVADGWIGRAGSSTLAEALAFEVPGLLIPYPHATGGHQELNAQFFCKTIGGGVMLREKEITPSSFDRHFHQIWSHRSVLKQAMRAYKRESTRRFFSELVWEALYE